MTDKILILSTCASQEEAERVARVLVEGRLAACVAITPNVQSIYRWKGAVESSEEWGLAIKTRRHLFEDVRASIRAIHSYQVPELLALPVIDGDPDYLGWMDEQLP